MRAVAEIPGVQRDLYLSRVIRLGPGEVTTTAVVYGNGITVNFDSDAAVATAVVSIGDTVDIATYTQEVNRLLDMAVVSEKETVIKWAARLMVPAKMVAATLMDRVASIEGGTYIGAMKLRRRGISHGYAKIRADETQQTVEVVVRHRSPHGAKAVWASVRARLAKVS